MGVKESANTLRVLTQAERIPPATASPEDSISWLERVNKAMAVLGEEPENLHVIPAGHIVKSSVYSEYLANMVAHARDKSKAILDGLEDSPVAGERDAARIFIVHGHNRGVMSEVARYINQCVEAEPIILRELPHKGQPLFAKLLREAKDSDAAIVLMTGDDFGGSLEDGVKRNRARQNVVFEAGLFVGLLGTKRMAFLYEAGVEMPSDLAGMAYVEYKDGWHSKLANEITEWGVRVDFTGVSRLV